MKKALITLTLLAVGSTMAYAGDKGCCSCTPPPSCNKPCCAKHCHKPPMPPKMNLDEQLKLTDEQKAQAKELRMQAREQMKPIMEALKTKHEQKQIIKRNQSLTAEAQCEQVEKLNAEIVELKKQAREIRLKNQKDFEAILTEKQKKELQKIKTNARKEMMKKHKNCPPRAYKK